MDFAIFSSKYGWCITNLKFTTAINFRMLRPLTSFYVIQELVYFCNAPNFLLEFETMYFCFSFTQFLS